MFVSMSSNCVKYLIGGAEVIQRYTEVLLELNTFPHIHVLLVQWTDLYSVIQKDEFNFVLFLLFN